MKMMRSVGISLVMSLLSAPLIRGQDLSKYRGLFARNEFARTIKPG
jgi:hypothetical protein